MKNKNILDAMNDIDFDMVEDAMSKPRQRVKTLWFRYSILAACMGLLAALAIGMPLGLFDIDEDAKNQHPDLDERPGIEDAVTDPPSQYPIYGGADNEENLPKFPFSDDFQLSLQYQERAYLGCCEKGVTYTFVSADESVVKVDQYGTVESVGSGETTISITAENLFGKSSIVIRVVSDGPWRPITPADFEWVEVKNSMKYHANMWWHDTYMSPTSKYNIHGTVFGEADAGPISISNGKIITLFEFIIKDEDGWEEEYFYNTEDMYLDLYFYEFKNGMGNYRRYEKVTLPIEKLWMDIPEEGQTRYFYQVDLYTAMEKYFAEKAIFRTTMVLRKGDTRLLYGSDDFRCTRYVMACIEYILANPDEFEK